jgi:hypothetical protein
LATFDELDLLVNLSRPSGQLVWFGRSKEQAPMPEEVFSDGFAISARPDTARSQARSYAAAPVQHPERDEVGSPRPVRRTPSTPTRITTPTRRTTFERSSVKKQGGSPTTQIRGRCVAVQEVPRRVPSRSDLSCLRRVPSDRERTIGRPRAGVGNHGSTGRLAEPDPRPGSRLTVASRP